MKPLLARVLVFVLAAAIWLAGPLWTPPRQLAPGAEAMLAVSTPGVLTPAAGPFSAPALSAPDVQTTPAPELPAVIAPRIANEVPPASASGPAKSQAVTAIGDSVMLAAAADLQAAIANITIDAVVGRQVPAALEILRGRKAAGTLGSVVVIGMGTNGYFTSAQLDEMMDLLPAVGRVLFVDVKCPTAWETADNLMLQEAVKRYPQVAVVGWHAASANRPELFWDDGIHLRPEGARVYAALVAAAVNGR